MTHFRRSQNRFNRTSTGKNLKLSLFKHFKNLEYIPYLPSSPLIIFHPNNFFYSNHFPPRSPNFLHDFYIQKMQGLKDLKQPVKYHTIASLFLVSHDNLSNLSKKNCTPLPFYFSTQGLYFTQFILSQPIIPPHSSFSFFFPNFFIQKKQRLKYPYNPVKISFDRFVFINLNPGL